jgi:hypothetical protein
MQAKNYLVSKIILVILAALPGLNCDDAEGLGPWQVFELKELPENTWVIDLCMLSSKEGWGCVGGSEILKYDGYKWFIYKDVTITKGYVSLAAIDFSGTNDGWLVGTKHMGEPPPPGLIMHYDGKEWKDVTPPGISPLGAVFALAPDDVWVGGYGIWHYEGSSWELTAAVDAVRGLHFTSPDDGWAVAGFGLYFHWDGSSWTQVRSWDMEMRDDVFFPTPEEGWAVGGGTPVPEAPAYDPIYHYYSETGEWKRWGHPAEAAGKTLHAVHFASPDDGWAAGQVVLRWDGRNWRYVPCPFVAFDVFTLGGDEVWLGCVDRKILKYDPSRR